jgi:hypothetical protein
MKTSAQNLALSNNSGDELGLSADPTYTLVQALASSSHAVISISIIGGLRA